MANKKFTKAELAALLASPHVLRATDNAVSFTDAFRKEFWEKYSHGITAWKIFSEAGIDPSALGESRISGFVTTLRKIYLQDGGITAAAVELESDLKIAAALLAREVQRLAHKVAYMEQELDFIKKIILADNSAKQKKP